MGERRETEDVTGTFLVVPHFQVYEPPLQPQVPKWHHGAVTGHGFESPLTTLCQ